MDKQEAIAAIREIQNGGGTPNRDGIKNLRGSIAVKLWDDERFHYGMEYGAIAALMFAFGITEQEIVSPELWRSAEETAQLEASGSRGTLAQALEEAA